ncbi:hypothetical protein LCGC14_0521020 [marine sediment metagenome]|uniref:Uncharacterized protein n=1 Tax=marine sediment metagenome TaxID=412755 RepID=A0A0F9S377_9ZZZZ
MPTTYLIVITNEELKGLEAEAARNPKASNIPDTPPIPVTAEEFLQAYVHRQLEGWTHFSGQRKAKERLSGYDKASPAIQQEIDRLLGA